MCIYLRKEKGTNVNFFIKFRNLESMTKKRSSEICRMKSYMEKCHLRNFSSQSKKFSEIGGNASLSQGGWSPLPLPLYKNDVASQYKLDMETEV